MQTIYIDVLIVLNIYINFFLIKTTSKITHTQIKFTRCAAASVYGSLFSLLILIPHINFWVNIIIKSVAAITIIMIAFGIHSLKILIINSISFFIVNFIFAGFIYAVYSWLKPDFIYFNNTYFYIDFSLVLLVCTTAALYFAVYAVRYFFDRTPKHSGYYRVIIKYKNRIVSLSGIADTGNSLVDFFSGKSVIVCGEDKIQEVTGEKSFDSSCKSIPKGFRIIPCSTIFDSGVISIFCPDEVIIVDTEKNEKKSVKALIGFGCVCSEAIFNPKLLR